MNEAKPSSTAGGRRGAAPRRRGSEATKEARPADAESLAEQLLRLLDPREIVVLTRDRVQDVLDDAVARGRMTRADASLLVSELIHRGRRQTEDLVADLEQLVGHAPEPVRRDARRGIAVTFPIPGYDDLTAAQVTSQISELTPAELRKVRDYERRNANRKSVLTAVEQRLG
jgi:hypothetical protein